MYDYADEARREEDMYIDNRYLGRQVRLYTGYFQICMITLDRVQNMHAWDVFADNSLTYACCIRNQKQTDWQKRRADRKGRISCINHT